jgi:hypothetical protein
MSRAVVDSAPSVRLLLIAAVQHSMIRVNVSVSERPNFRHSTIQPLKHRRILSGFRRGLARIDHGQHCGLFTGHASGPWRIRANGPARACASRPRRVRRDGSARNRVAHGAEIAISAVYTTLERLEGKGLVRSRVGEPTAERGGRRRRHFELLPLGARALKTAYDAFTGMTAGLERQLKELA